MSFTGSPEVGRLVGEACGRNLVPVKLELGGKGAAVVFDDVDVSRHGREIGRCDHISHRPSLLRRDSLVGSSKTSTTSSSASASTGCSKSRSDTSSTKRHKWDRSSMRSSVERVLGYLEKGQAEGAECS